MLPSVTSRTSFWALSIRQQRGRRFNHFCGVRQGAAASEVFGNWPHGMRNTSVEEAIDKQSCAAKAASVLLDYLRCVAH
jgi:hypothetical protein